MRSAVQRPGTCHSQGKSGCCGGFEIVFVLYLAIEGDNANLRAAHSQIKPNKVVLIVDEGNDPRLAAPAGVLLRIFVKYAGGYKRLYIIGNRTFVYFQPLGDLCS